MCALAIVIVNSLTLTHYRHTYLGYMYLGYSFIADFRCQLICQSLIWEWGSVYTRDGLYASMYGKSQAEMF